MHLRVSAAQVFCVRGKRWLITRNSAQSASPEGRLSITEENGDYLSDEPHHSNGDLSPLENDSGARLQQRLLDHQKNGNTEAEASSLIKLDNGDVLYMREVNR